MRADPKVYEIFTHFKGMKYQILAVATHSETREKYVVYQALYGDYQVYVRPFDMFMSEVDHDKYPQVTQKYRFSREYEAVEPQQETVPVTQDEVQTKEAQSPIDDELSYNIDPLVLEFLDADTYEARLNILAAIHHKVTDDMINTMAVAIDVEIDEGPIEERFDALKTCLLTRDKYECTRL